MKQKVEVSLPPFSQTRTIEGEMTDSAQLRLHQMFSELNVLPQPVGHLSVAVELLWAARA